MFVLLLHLLLAAVLVLLGRWGRRHAHNLVWPGLPQGDRARRVAAVRRGGGLCYLVAAALTLVGMAGVVG